MARRALSGRTVISIASVRLRGPALSEWASFVGGDATTDRDHPGRAALMDPDNPAAPYVRRVLQAAQDLDPGGLQAHLDGAVSVLGLDRCVDEIVVPATREMQRRRVTDQPETALDLMGTEAIRAWLTTRALLAPAPRDVGPIVLACGPRDRQVVELESLALLLRLRRWPCRVLGARTSTFTLTIAAQAADATAAVVMSTDSRGLPPAILSVLAIDALGLPVFFAGNAFQTRPGLDQLPGRYLGSSISAACSLLISTLTPDTQRRAASTDCPAEQGR